jgi:hypothetical protein
MSEITELQAKLKKASEETAQACSKEIAAVLEKYGCQLVAQPFITDDGRISVNVVIVPA